MRSGRWAGRFGTDDLMVSRSKARRNRLRTLRRQEGAGTIRFSIYWKLIENHRRISTIPAIWLKASSFNRRRQPPREEGPDGDRTIADHIRDSRRSLCRTAVHRLRFAGRRRPDSIGIGPETQKRTNRLAVRGSTRNGRCAGSATFQIYDDSVRRRRWFRGGNGMGVIIVCVLFVSVSAYLSCRPSCPAGYRLERPTIR